MKKVFIGVLAVMMLVAFTACEQPTIKYPANVSYITIEQTGDFIEGQTFKASNFAVYAHDTNGDSTVVPGANVTLSTKDVTKLEAGETYTAHAELKVAGETGNLTADLDFTAYAIESYTFTGVPALVAYVNDSDAGYVYATTAEAMTASEYAAAVNAITVSVTYNGTSTMPLTLTATEKAQLISSLCVVNELGQKVTDDDFKVGTTYALAVGATKVGGEDSTPAIATNLTATGVAEAPEGPASFNEAKIVSIKISHPTTDVVYYGDTLAEHDEDFVVVATDENGLTKEYKGDDTKVSLLYVQNGKAVADYSTTSAVTVYATVQGMNGAITDSTSVTPTDYINDISVEVDKNYKPAEFTQLDKSKITVKGRLASAGEGTDPEDYTVAISTNNFSVNVGILTTENAQSVTVSTTYRIKGTTPVTESTSITLAD